MLRMGYENLRTDSSVTKRSGQHNDQHKCSGNSTANHAAEAPIHGLRVMATQDQVDSAYHQVWMTGKGDHRIVSVRAKKQQVSIGS